MSKPRSAIARSFHRILGVVGSARSNAAPGTSAPSTGGSSSLGRDEVVLARVGLAALIATAAYIVIVAGISTSPVAAADTCPNAFFRTGASAKLPDCRAYELVSPANTGPNRPTATTIVNTPASFESPLISPSRDSVVFLIQGGALSGFEGTGFEDGFRATRGSDGWTSEQVSPTASQSEQTTQGPASPDHTYFPYRIFTGLQRNEGTLLTDLGFTDSDTGSEILGLPDGTFERIYVGSLGSTLDGELKWMTAGADHIVFESDVDLEPGVTNGAVYDRSPGGPTHVVSLLPGDVPATVFPSYAGISRGDGDTIAFTSGGIANLAIYVRLDNATTLEVARSNGVIAGKELSCAGGPGSATVSYEWLRNGTPIGGATASTYTAIAADEGAVVQCQVTADIAGEGTTLRTNTRPAMVAPFPETMPPVPTGNPSISGTGNVGQLLSCNNGDWEFGTSPAISHQWFRNGAPISGATANTYTVVGADVGTAVQCRVTGTTAGGVAHIFSTFRLIGALPPTATADPAISNVTDPGNPPAAGDQLSCSDGTWTNSPTFTYQWLRDGAEIAGATANTYTVVTPDDDGKTLQCRVTGANADATAQAVSNRVVADPQPGTAPPDLTTVGAVSGTATVGNNLTCNTGTWTDPGATFTYQWLRNGAEIGGAIANTYTLGAADRQTTIQCRVTATNAGGSAVAVNANAGARYVNPNPPSASATGNSLGLDFSGVTDHGEYVFYTQGGGNFFPGNILSFDTATGEVVPVTPLNVTDAEPTHISDDGNRVYYVSETEIGGEGTAGQPNLYLWERFSDTTTFVATLSASDVDQQSLHPEANNVSLVSWNNDVWREGFKDKNLGAANQASRSTPDGSVLVFESKAQLTAYDNAGHREIYRYDGVADTIECVSCAGPGPATGDAAFQTYSGGLASPQPIASLSPVPISDDGETVFFESTEQLVPGDTNDKIDVYRWKKGEGISLISLGKGSLHSYLYAASEDGNDVVFLTYDHLLPQDENSVGALYDARVNGGFPPPDEFVTEPCSGDACQGTPSAAPEAPRVASSSLVGTGNLKPQRLRCSKGKRKVRRAGKVRCVKRKRHRRTSSNRRAAR